MFETKTAQTMMDESSRCRDRSRLLVEDAKRLNGINPASSGGYDRDTAGTAPEALNVQFRGLIRLGQEVYLPGDQFIGITTKLFINPDGQISHLAIRTARLFGRHKLVPVASVSDVTTLRVQLSIDRDAFMELPGYHTDLFIAEEVDRALWKDVVLRDTDYHQIDVRVQDGNIQLNGHVMTSMNQWRAETAAKNIPGSLSVTSYLIPDDKLSLEVAKALGQIGHETASRHGDSRLYTKLENGVVFLMGEESSTLLRDQVEQCVAEIPWVRGIINEINIPGIDLNVEEQRFLQPLIGKELLFKDTLSVTIHKVVINPHNRRVVAVVVLGRVPGLLQRELDSEPGGEISPERLMVIAVRSIIYLTHNAGFLQAKSTDAGGFEEYDPSRYTTPGQNWMPPYPYCTDEVLFRAE